MVWRGHTGAGEGNLHTVPLYSVVYKSQGEMYSLGFNQQRGVKHEVLASSPLALIELFVANCPHLETACEL